MYPQLHKELIWLNCQVRKVGVTMEDAFDNFQLISLGLFQRWMLSMFCGITQNLPAVFIALGNLSQSGHYTGRKSTSWWQKSGLFGERVGLNTMQKEVRIILKPSSHNSRFGIMRCLSFSAQSSSSNSAQQLSYSRLCFLFTLYVLNFHASYACTALATRFTNLEVANCL